MNLLLMQILLKPGIARNKIVIATIVVILFVLVGWSFKSPVSIYLIGDSTMADKPIIDNPERGWGQMFPLFFDENTTVENRARNGRSTKSFIDEGRWADVDEKLKPGDYVFIQFGHNDEKIADTTRYAAPHTTFKNNLIYMVNQSREKGAIPVLLTPVQRRKFDDAGRLVDTHGDYPAVVREVAMEKRVSLIDLTKESTELFDRLGPENTKSMFMWIPSGVFASLPDGKEDNTHFTEFGAIEIARLVSDALKRSTMSLSTHLRPFTGDSLLGLNKIVALDYFYNREWKEVGTKKVQFHYVWEDTANSGFSQLGKVIADLGAYTSKLQSAPNLLSLSKYSVYIIVDPDTPSETEQPNFIDDSSATQIAEWVIQGGVLVLMGNDKGNAEFDHLNRLAERFGIHFNEDSYHRVVGQDFDAGKFANLPNHPIFTGVKQIYLKEISSFSIETPAVALLTEHGKTFMATARFGKGTVFAVGDPWLYNEYIDSRKLPASFENTKAGQGLFRWLLEQASPTMH